MRIVLVLLFALTQFIQAASATTFEDRARQKGELAWQRQLGQVQSTIRKENRRQLRQLYSFIARHGGAVSDPICRVSKMSCYNEGGGYTACAPYDIQRLPLSSIDPDAQISIGDCSFDLRDGLACESDRQRQKTTVNCYDSRLRYRTFNLGK